jgi:hypothetical protein
MLWRCLLTSEKAGADDGAESSFASRRRRSAAVKDNGKSFSTVAFSMSDSYSIVVQSPAPYSVNVVSGPIVQSSFDGQYSSLLGIPSTFAPSAHSHSIADVTGLGTLATQSPTGTPSASTFLRGDYSWQTIDLSGYQPLDSDLTAIAALSTTAFGRSVLTQVNAASMRTLIGAGTSSFDGSYASLSNIPSIFSPSAHTHPVSQITGGASQAFAIAMAVAL